MPHINDRQHALNLARDATTPAATLEVLARDPRVGVRKAVAAHPNLSMAFFERLSQDSTIAETIAANERTPPELLTLLLGDSNMNARRAALNNPNTPRSAVAVMIRAGTSTNFKAITFSDPTLEASTIESLSEGRLFARQLVVRHPNTPISLLQRLTSDEHVAIRDQALSRLTKNSQMSGNEAFDAADSPTSPFKVGERFRGFVVIEHEPDSKPATFIEHKLVNSGWKAQLRGVHHKSPQSGSSVEVVVLSTHEQKRVLQVREVHSLVQKDTSLATAALARAVRGTLAILDGNFEITLADDASSLKGICKQVVGRTEPDWLTYYHALGAPHDLLTREMAGFCSGLARAIRTSNVGTASALIKRDVSGVFEHTLRVAFERFQSRTDAHIPQVTESLSPKNFATVTKFNARAAKKIESAIIYSSYAKSKTMEATEQHQHTLELLRKYLEPHGILLQSNVYIDALLQSNDYTAIFEAKSLTESNEIDQVRAAISQLYEYRYSHALPAASLWILLSHELHHRWLIDYLERDRGVHVLWIDEQEVSGPSHKKLDELIQNITRFETDKPRNVFLD